MSGFFNSLGVPRWYVRTKILGFRVEFLRGNVAWELVLGRSYVQVMYRRFWHAFGFIRGGRF